MRSPKTWYWAVVVVMVIVAMAVAAVVTGGPAILSAQTVEQSSGQGTDTRIAATEAEIQRRFNELRRELLDDRADTINWWLAATAIFLTLIGVVTPIVGGIAAYIGFNRFRSVEAEARQSVEQARRSAEEAAEHVKGIRRSREQAEEYTQRIHKMSLSQQGDTQDNVLQQTIIDYTTDYLGVGDSAQEARRKADASFLDRAIAEAYSLQQEGKIEEAIKKWQAIADLAEGIDDDLAVHAWFSVGYLQEEGRHGESSGS